MLRAGVLSLLIVASLLVLLNPPSLSGAGGLAALAGGAVVFVVAAAWVSVRLTGRSAMSDAEVERLVDRSERLARAQKAGSPGQTYFEALVADAIDRLPSEFRRLLADIPVIVSQNGGSRNLYGHYSGETMGHGTRQGTIVVYQDTLERDFGFDSEALAEQVERTLRHELAHHLGWDEGGVRSLGL